VKIAIRGFAGKTKIFEDVIKTDGTDLEALAEIHMARLLAYNRHMIEFEFLDEPDPLQRFFRFGTDPSGMVQPIAIDLTEGL
jgi:hypothetical protein